MKEYIRRTCTVCGEDKNIFGGCKCNGYTTAFNKESQQTDTQQTQPENITVDSAGTIHIKFDGPAPFGGISL